MSVFYFCDYKGINILKNLEIKLSLPSELNDPFDSFPYDENGCITDFENHQRASGGMIFYLSMCRTYKNPRMWSHYASNHSGLMIEFDENAEPFKAFKDAEDRMFDVDYDTNKRVPMKLLQKDPSKYFHELAKRKGSDWKEEKEVRFYLASCWKDEMNLSIHDIIVDDKLITLMKISKESIVSVTYGFKASANLRDTILRLVRELNSNILIYEALPYGDSFNIMRKELKYK